MQFFFNEKIVKSYLKHLYKREKIRKFEVILHLMYLHNFALYAVGLVFKKHALIPPNIELENLKKINNIVSIFEEIKYIEKENSDFFDVIED